MTLHLQLFAALILLFPGLVLASPSESDVEILESGSRAEKTVALTFDACSSARPRLDRGVVDTLVRLRAPATLFLGGRWMEAFPEETRELARHPFLELASHGYGHPHFDRLDAGALQRELRASQKVFRRLLGRPATLVRPPYGDFDERAVAVARKLGLRTVLWDLPSGDPDPSFTAGKLAENVVRRARGGSIVVLHMNGNGHHTAEALGPIIEGLRARGLRLVTVGEMLSSGSLRPVSPRAFLAKQAVEKERVRKLVAGREAKRASRQLASVGNSRSERRQVFFPLPPAASRGLLPCERLRAARFALP